LSKSFDLRVAYIDFHEVLSHEGPPETVPGSHKTTFVAPARTTYSAVHEPRPPQPQMWTVLSAYAATAAPSLVGS
jgi:hypothetical protein